jgi:hypothetical protein
MSGDDVQIAIDGEDLAVGLAYIQHGGDTGSHRRSPRDIEANIAPSMLRRLFP